MRPLAGVLLGSGSFVSLVWLASRGWSALLAAAIVLAWLYLWQRFLVRRTSTALVIIIGLALRAAWLVLVPTEPNVDFASYHAFATGLASGVSSELLFKALPTQEVGYPLFLGGVYSLVGVSVAAGRAANMLLSLWLLMAVRRLLESQGVVVTRTGVMLVALWPAHIAMSSLLASENLFLPLLWTAVALATAHAFFGGLLLGLAQAVRPTALVMIVALMVRRSWRPLAALSLGLVVGFGGYRLLRSVAGDPVVRGGAAFSALVGSNRESVGAWNAVDHRWYAQKVEELGADAAAAEARTKALGRLTAAPLETVGLMAHKFSAQWGNGSVAVTFAMPAPAAPLLAWSDAWAVSLWVLALWRAVKGPSLTDLERWVVLALGVACAGHLLLEANARYALPWMVGVALLAAARLGVTRTP
ncbi:MAG: hypothetical protein JNM69_15600 [Archangium sp.]|nr:hypothetical protein [Archangium sp.]